jgi:hypothetical protein
LWPILEDAGEVPLPLAHSFHFEGNGLDRLLESLESFIPWPELAVMRLQLGHAFTVLEESKEDAH